MWIAPTFSLVNHVTLIAKKVLCYTFLESQRSSVVEQRFRKPSVKSSTLFAGSIYFTLVNLLVIFKHFLSIF